MAMGMLGASSLPRLITHFVARALVHETDRNGMWALWRRSVSGWVEQSLVCMVNSDVEPSGIRRARGRARRRVIERVPERRSQRPSETKPFQLRWDFHPRVLDLSCSFVVILNPSCP
eukprot:2169842-Pyramimonas_sp.AAC.1